MCVCANKSIHNACMYVCMFVTHMKLFDAVGLVVEECLCSLNGFLPPLSLILGLLNINLGTLRLTENDQIDPTFDQTDTALD